MYNKGQASNATKSIKKQLLIDSLLQLETAFIYITIHNNVYMYISNLHFNLQTKYKQNTTKTDKETDQQTTKETYRNKPTKE